MKVHADQSVTQEPEPPSPRDDTNEESEINTATCRTSSSAAKHRGHSSVSHRRRLRHNGSHHHRHRTWGRQHLTRLHNLPVQAYKTGVEVIGKPILETTKSFTESFKTFIESRSVVEVAVAFVMGLAFREICTSLVTDVFGPLLGLVLPFSDGTLAEQFYMLRNPKNVSGAFLAELVTREQAQAAGAITINYGHFIKTIFDFLLLCFVLYLFINFFYLKLISHPAVTFPCAYCKEDVKEGALWCPHCTQFIGEQKQETPETTAVVDA